MPLDFNHVAPFVEVVRSGSFAASSRRVGLPPNTVSRRVRQLELQLGSRLLHRSTRRLTLTAAGEALFARCRDAVAEIAQAGDELVEDGRQPAGHVRVAAPADSSMPSRSAGSASSWRSTRRCASSSC